VGKTLELERFGRNGGMVLKGVKQKMAMEDAEAPQQLDKGGVVDGCCAIENLIIHRFHTSF
jgi:hypothetical protein